MQAQRPESVVEDGRDGPGGQSTALEAGVEPVAHLGRPRRDVDQQVDPPDQATAVLRLHRDGQWQLRSVEPCLASALQVCTRPFQRRWRVEGFREPAGKARVVGLQQRLVRLRDRDRAQDQGSVVTERAGEPRSGGGGQI